MKKFLKLTTLVVSMVMALTFVSCANGNTSNNGNENSNENTSNNGNESSNENTSNNGNENSNEEELNLVGTYGLSKVESIFKSPKEERSLTKTMPTSTSLRLYCTQKLIKGKTTTVIEREMDVTITKTADGYSFNWAKYNINGEAASDDAKAAEEATFTDDTWNSYTAMFAMTITTTAEGTWSNNYTPATSGTYTVDKANSKVTMKTLISNGETLQEPGIMEATYSNNGKTLVVVMDDSTAEETLKTTMTFTRK